MPRAAALALLVISNAACKLLEALPYAALNRQVSTRS